jgi:hypothetical protein
MARNKLSSIPSKQFEMATIMVGQWTDERLKKAQAIDLIRAYGLDVIEAEKILDKELRKRKWK